MLDSTMCNYAVRNGDPITHRDSYEMLRRRSKLLSLFSLIALLCSISTASAQKRSADSVDEEFGPVVRAYLGYLRDEQEVVDDRASRREITPQYYRRNSNRIRALRRMAISIARETGNDYLPELEAATRDELSNLFERPPSPRTFRVGAIIGKTYRYLGAVRSAEMFYVFARLDPYEQSDLVNKAKESSATPPAPTPLSTSNKEANGPRVTRPPR